jgi:glyoxylase-like metal-dependent hydrolase (beta-lactamase superfamily II)
VQLELIHVGPAHTPGDSLVWLPQQQIAFAGDVVYVERMLGVMPMSKSGHWIEAFDTLAELQPNWVVPGHGHAVTLDKARAETYDYLVFLREAVGKMLEEGVGMERVGEIDQSAFSHLKVYEQIKGRNAQQVYTEMEWE